MTATEDVLFVMPKDRELQFPAMAALQMYVNNYKIKMEANCVTPQVPVYKFRYWADMSDDGWEFFQLLGIDLKQARETIAFPDSVIELTDEKLMSFFNSEKHCAQACSAIAGVETPPYPLVKQVQPAEWDGRCVCLGSEPYESFASMVYACQDAGAFAVFDDWDYLLSLTEAARLPIAIGVQSWETYAAAAMGMPVIEILPKGRSVNWLSKFKNPLYRVIEEDHLDRLPDVLANIKEVMQWRFSKALADKDSATTTARSASTVVNAGSTSATRL
jgi:hypothetical protein